MYDNVRKCFELRRERTAYLIIKLWASPSVFY